MKENKNRKRANKTHFPYVGMLFILTELVASGVAMWYLHRIDVVPNRYLVSIWVVISICLLINFGMQFRPKLHILGKVLAFLMCCLLVGVCYYEHNTLKLLKNVTADVYDYDNYVVVVKKDSDIKDVYGLMNKKMGVCKSMNNATSVDSAIADIKEKTVRFDTEEFETLSYQINALLNDEVDAVLYNENFDSIITEAVEGYGDAVNIVATFEVKTLVAETMPTMEIVTRKEEGSTKAQEEPKSTEPVTYADKISTGENYYNPALDPNAAVSGGYIGGDTSKDNSSKGPITNRAFNILVVGADNYGTLAGRSRHDVNILITVNPMTKTILMTNTPRDYFVPIPGITYGSYRDKLTHAGIYGVWSSVASIENVYEVDIDYYLRVNFTSFMMIVDALGGVDVYSDYDFRQFKKGMNHISNGSSALTFARERYAFPSGDRQRGINQMHLIEAILNKIMSPAILTNFSQTISSLSNALQTNMTMDEITSLLKMQIDDMASWNIISQSVSGSGAYKETYSMPGWSLYVMLPNQSDIDNCKNNIYKTMGK